MAFACGRSAGIAPHVAAQSGGVAVPSTLPSAIRVDREEKTVKLPLYRGLDRSGRNVYFVVLDASNVDEATRRGVNWAPKLKNARGTAGVQETESRLATPGTRTQSPVTFEATVDFDSNAGRGGYSPLLTAGGTVYNAPHVENGTGRHPSVRQLDRRDMEVTLELTEGFHRGTPVLYLSTDAAPEDVADSENAVYAPALTEVPAAGDRALESSAREALFVVLDGDPRQRNVTRSSQVCRTPNDPTTCTGFYSPVWDVYTVFWTAEAVDAGMRRPLQSHEEVIDLFLGGALGSATPDGPLDTLLANIPASGAVVDGSIVFTALAGGGG